MLDTTLTLINKCIELVKSRQEADKGLYVSFVQSALIDFDAVHKDYLASFQKYRQLVATTTAAFDGKHPLLQIIKTDALFSNDLRSKLHALHPLKSDPVAGRLIAAIGAYLKDAVDIDPASEGPKGDPCSPAHDNLAARKDEAGTTLSFVISGDSNVIRTSFGTGLERLFEAPFDDKTKHERALAFLDAMVAQLQARYATVMREHMGVKQRLLSGK